MIARAVKLPFALSLDTLLLFPLRYGSYSFSMGMSLCFYFSMESTDGSLFLPDTLLAVDL